MLLVLTVIGVVASLTIPTLVQKVSDDRYKVAWKRAYSDISQVLNRILGEHGNFNAFLPASQSLKPELLKHMLSIKDCGSNACVSTGNVYKSLYGTAIANDILDEGQFVMNNSNFVMIQNSGNMNWHIVIWVDVNGYDRAPNVLGKDLFAIKVTYDKYWPMGADGSGFENSCNPSTAFIGPETRELQGAGCSAEYLYK